MSVSLSENLAAEFLRLIDEGWEPDLEEFLLRVPEENRDECRQRIEELARLNAIEIPSAQTEADSEPEPESLDELAQEIAPEEAPASDAEPQVASTEAESEEQPAEEAAPEDPSGPRVRRASEELWGQADVDEEETPRVEGLQTIADQDWTTPAVPAEVAEPESQPDEDPAQYEETEEASAPADAQPELPERPRYVPRKLKRRARSRVRGSRVRLEREIGRHVREVDSWRRRKLLPESESDRLTTVYRRLVHHEAGTNMGELGGSLARVLFCAVAMLSAVGAAMLVWPGVSELPPVVSGAMPAFVFLALLGAGVWASRRRSDPLGATVFLVSAALAALPAALAVTAAFALFTVPSPGAVQLLREGSFTNSQLLVATGSGLVVTLLGFALVRRAVFAWMSVLLALASYGAFLSTQNVLGLELHEAALRLLPLAVLVVPALFFEHSGKARWARPFGLVALVALVGCLDALAVGGKLLQLVHLDAFLPASQQAYLGFTLAGVVLLVAMLFMELADSLELRAGARVLRVVVPVQIVASLYLSARSSGVLGDAVIFLAANAGLLVLCRWKNRIAFFLAGLAGLALGAHLLVDLGLVRPAVFTMALAAGGLLIGVGGYVLSQRRDRSAGNAPEPEPDREPTG